MYVNSINNVLFIHSELDEYGLTTSEFRVLCHISRRIGKNKNAWCSTAAVARICRLNIKTAREAIKNLKNNNILNVKNRFGFTNLYQINDINLWKRPYPKENPTQNRQVVPKMGTPPTQNELVPPTQKSTHEGNTISNYNEGDTLKKYNTVNVIKTNLDSEVLQIYNEYPRKVGKLVAFKAIQKALVTTAFIELLNATKAYCNATKHWSSEKQNYIPYPATWFNQGRYLDDPKTWEATNKDRARECSLEHLERLKAF